MAKDAGSTEHRRTSSGPSAARLRALNARLRLAFLAGAEERSRSVHGRGLTDDELRRIIGRYPGDVVPR